MSAAVGIAAALGVGGLALAIRARTAPLTRSELGKILEGDESKPGNPTDISLPTSFPATATVVRAAELADVWLGQRLRVIARLVEFAEERLRLSEVTDPIERALGLEFLNDPADQFDVEAARNEFPSKLSIQVLAVVEVRVLFRALELLRGQLAGELTVTGQSADATTSAIWPQVKRVLDGIVKQVATASVAAQAEGITGVTVADHVRVGVNKTLGGIGDFFDALIPDDLVIIVLAVGAVVLVRTLQ